MNVCETCRSDTRMRPQVCGFGKLCGHHVHLDGNAYCLTCAEAKKACLRCGGSLEAQANPEEDPPTIVRGID